MSELDSRITRRFGWTMLIAVLAVVPILPWLLDGEGNEPDFQAIGVDDPTWTIEVALAESLPVLVAQRRAELQETERIAIDVSRAKSVAATPLAVPDEVEAMTEPARSTAPSSFAQVIFAAF